MNNFLDTLLTSSVALAAIGATCKVFLQHIDKRELESFKLNIKNESDRLILMRNLEIEKKSKTVIELGRWSNTLLSATNGYIGRLKYIKANTPDINDDYLLKSTRFYIAQYLCWEQIYRKNRDTTLLSPVNDEILISDLMKNISIVMRKHDSNHPSIRSLEQCYIGEKMMSDNKCISYSEYIESSLTLELTVLNKFSDSILEKKDLAILDSLIFHLEKLQYHFKAVLMKSQST
ncbi:hypothetical protein [Pantoea anthophila]|uniref:hypothetical protein n=1 Tax=Pantoea anthophila TaxID=470931 RepID=UPI0030192CEE